MNLHDHPFFAHLESSQHILLAGMGGGFDLYCGVPLYLALRAMGKQVTLANLTFANTRALGPRIHRVAVKVNAESGPEVGYFPERHLCAWSRDTLGEELEVICFERDGEVAVREAYEAVVALEGIDALVLVDGGTDSLMRGDEAGLGTPHEDMLSLAVAEQLELPVKLLVSLGFGVDRFHGVCHAHMLENVAAWMREGAFLGTFALLPQMSEAQRYLELVDYANARTPRYESIVNNSIASAVEGEYGDVHRTHRTEGGTLWINPLMTLYWVFELDAVARSNDIVAEVVRGTESFQEIIVRMEAFEGRRERRPWTDIPV